MNILIATARYPQESQADQIFAAIREAALEEGLEIPGFLWCSGPGCSNLVFEAIGDDEAAERLANSVTMALMPAKWCETVGEMPIADEVTL